MWECSKLPVNGGAAVLPKNFNISTGHLVIDQEPLAFQSGLLFTLRSVYSLSQVVLGLLSDLQNNSQLLIQPHGVYPRFICLMSFS